MQNVKNCHLRTCKCSFQPSQDTCVQSVQEMTTVQQFMMKISEVSVTNYFIITTYVSIRANLLKCLCLS